MKKLKVGIIGAGRIGQVHAKSITYHIPQAEILAISDIYEDGAAKVANELGIPAYYKDYHKILENPDIDAVLICSSTDTHADIACEAASIFFAKNPLTLQLQKSKRLSKPWIKRALSFKSASTEDTITILRKSKSLSGTVKSASFKQLKSQAAIPNPRQSNMLRFRAAFSLI